MEGFFPVIKSDLYGVCLLSAFDLVTRKIPADISDVADVVILDSGSYETDEIPIPRDRHYQAPANMPWSREDYRAFLKTLGAEVNTVAVSFDTYAPVQDQIAAAREDVAVACEAASDFLVKPKQRGQHLNIEEITAAASALAQFDVIGVTDKELGNSIVEKCMALLVLRNGLSAAGLNPPIHVFGAITPGVMLAYLLCGADIFDGLNWLRFDYSGSGLTDIDELRIDDPYWEEPDTDRQLNTWRRNLSRLHRMQEIMRAFANGAPIQTLAEHFHSNGAFLAALRAARKAGAVKPSFTEGMK